MTKQKNPQEPLEEFSRRIRNYDSLNFLKERSILTHIMNELVKVDPQTIAEITSKQLQALPIRR
ncbi:MAG: hypothetical protein Q8R00_02895 [Candidatus Nanoarchaeia archaeon]|nr:hypothetical protein [Candidatus Nanoarchaeia archaeon]